MSIVRSGVSALVALLGSFGGSGETEMMATPRPAESLRSVGFRVEGPDYLVWDESRVEVESWKREIGPTGGSPPLICGACQRVHQPDGSWAEAVGDFEALRRQASYGLCPPCARERFPELLHDA